MQKYNSRIYTAISIALLLIALIPFSADARGLVPCGGNGEPACEVCHLYNLAKNIIDFLLWSVATPLLVVALLAGGFFWLTSAGSEEKISRGKNILFSAVVGFAIAFGAWVIINTILDTLAFQNPFYDTPWTNTDFCAQSPIRSDSGTGVGGIGNIVDNGSPQSGLAIDQGIYRDGIEYTDNAYLQENLNEALSQQLAMTQAGFPPGYNQQIDAQYGTLIDAAAAKYGVDPATMRAIIQAESSGNPNAFHPDTDGQSSYGLSQIRPGTARLLDPSNAGLSNAEIAQHLYDPAYSIDMQAKYLSQLSQKYSDPIMIAAAYNGGPNANAPSVNCPGNTRWQCQWDDNAHTVPNTGYQVTRNYTSKVTSLATSLRR